MPTAVEPRDSEKRAQVGADESLHNPERFLDASVVPFRVSFVAYLHSAT